MISKQIGQSAEYYIMYEILRKLGQITRLAPYIGWNNGGNESSSWILATGEWRDEGIWDDDALWID